MHAAAEVVRQEMLGFSRVSREVRGAGSRLPEARLGASDGAGRVARCLDVIQGAPCFVVFIQEGGHALTQQ